MRTRILHVLLLLVLAGSALAPASAAQAAVLTLSPKVSAAGLSPAGILNPDGTLRLDGTFSGALDLSGYDVQIDPQRGPVFGVAGSGAGAKPAAATGQWSSMGGGLQTFVDGSVVAIAVSGTDVYMGGGFDDANALPAADFIVKWDGAHWSALGSNGAGNGALDSAVYAIAVSGPDVYVGGAFGDINNNGVILSAADHVAKWDTLTGNWSALGSNGAGDGALNSTVDALAVSGSNLYVGGIFTNVNNNGTVLNTADYVARWNGASWNALGSNGAGDGSINYPVSALAVLGTDLYVGGIFTNVNNNGTPLPAADYIAKWSGGSWSALNSNGAGDGSLNGGVRALAVSGSYLYVGGDFTDAHNGVLALPSADYIARWDGSLWSALGTGAGNGSLNLPVFAIAVSGTDVYAGGKFYDVNNKGAVLTAADYIARFDGSNWTALGSNGAGTGSLNGTVAVIVVGGPGLYVGGPFENANNNGTALSAAHFIASWDGANWSAPAATNPSGTFAGSGADVRAVAVSGTTVYVGGGFRGVTNSSVVLETANYIAKWDSTTGSWSALGSNGTGGGALNGSVNAIAVSGSNVYVGGFFTNIINQGVTLAAADYVAKWDTLTGNWSALGSDGAGNGSLNNVVNALAVSGSNLYVGGCFIDANNNGTVQPSADYIARWDGTNWLPLLGNGVSDGSLNGNVLAIATSGSDLYVGGNFTDVNNSGNVLAAADYIAKWDGNNWSALGQSGAGNGALNRPVAAIAASGSSVYAGGDFTDVNNNGIALSAADYIAKWDGNNWSALGSNGAGNGALNNSVESIAVSGSSVYAGGYFDDANNNGVVQSAADYVARWDGNGWSALGSDGAGNGSLNRAVEALALGGSELYVGGMFSNVNNNGTPLTAADALAAYVLPTFTLTFNSSGAQDGWILETSEKSSKGGSINRLAKTFNLGDDASKKQYRAILSFATGAGLPDNALITGVTLKIKKNIILGGGNPVTMFNGFMLDIKNGAFGTPALQPGDFQAAASQTVGPFKPAQLNSWYSFDLAGASASINTLGTGLTQIRLRFKLDDNNNTIANDLVLYSGNATPAANRPQLIVIYHLP